MIIRGLAIPFNFTIDLPDGSRESVRANAFARMLADRTQQVKLQTVTHGDRPAIASTTDRSLELFTSDLGLWFEARLAKDHPNLRTALFGSGNQASVNFTKRRVTLIDGVEEITEACIDHVTIAISGASYDLTAVWCGDADLSNAPARIKFLAQQFPKPIGRSTVAAFASADRIEGYLNSHAITSRGIQ